MFCKTQENRKESSRRIVYIRKTIQEGTEPRRSPRMEKAKRTKRIVENGKKSSRGEVVRLHRNEMKPERWDQGTSHV